MTAEPVVIAVAERRTPVAHSWLIQVARSTSPKPWLRGHVAHPDQVPDDVAEALADFLARRGRTS